MRHPKNLDTWSAEQQATYWEVAAKQYDKVCVIALTELIRLRRHPTALVDKDTIDVVEEIIQED